VPVVEAALGTEMLDVNNRPGGLTLILTA